MITSTHTETKHQVDNEIPVEIALEKFRIRFPYSHVMVFDQYMVYGPFSKIFKVDLVREAENLIKDMELPLDAICEDRITSFTLIISAK